MSENSPHIEIPASEYEMSAIRSSGPGGQHVNKVATAILLRFDIHNSSLPPYIKEKLAAHKDKRITAGGMILIKADQNRSQKKNRDAAVARLHALIQKAIKRKKKRRKTKVPKGAIEARLKQKSKRSETKKMRKKVDSD